MENGSNMDVSTKAYYESVIEELKTNNKPKFLNNTEIQHLTDDIYNSVNEFIIDEYGLNPIHDFHQIKDVIFHKIHEKYGI